MPDPTTPTTPTFGPDVSGQSPEQDQARKRALNMGLLAAGLGLLSARTGGNVWRAIGEGGLTGLDAYSGTLAAEQKARDDKQRQLYEQERIDVSERRADIEQQRANAYQEHLAAGGAEKPTELWRYAEAIKSDYAAKGQPITDAQAFHMAAQDRPGITTGEMAKRSNYAFQLRMREHTTAETWARSRQTQKEAYEQQAQREAANLRGTEDLNKYLMTPFVPTGGTDRRPWTKSIIYNPDGTHKITLTPPPPTGMEKVFARILSSPPPPSYETPSMREPGVAGDGLPAYEDPGSPFAGGMDPVAGGFALNPDQEAQIRRNFAAKGWSKEQIDRFISSGGAGGYPMPVHDTGTFPHATPEIAPPLPAEVLSRYHITPSAAPPAGVPGISNGRHFVGTMLGKDNKTQIPVYSDGKEPYIDKKYKSLIPSNAASGIPPVGAVLVPGAHPKGKPNVPVYKKKEGGYWSP